MTFTQEEINKLIHAIGGYHEGERYIADTFKQLMEKLKDLRYDRSRMIDISRLIDDEMYGYKSALIREYGFTKPYNTLFARYDTLVTLWSKKNKIIDKKWD